MTQIMTELKILRQSVARHSSRVQTQLAVGVAGAARVFVFTAWLVVGGVCVASTPAQDQVDQVNSSVKASEVEAAKTTTKRPPATPARVSAREAVRLGNKHLIEGDAEGALEYYDEAQQLEPGAPQIAYVKGLGYFAAENYDEARQAFEQAAASDNEQLAGDAIYGTGITYHAQALASLDDPKAAIGNLESALERYRTVLANDPNHKAAKDAGMKAAMLRRQLVEQVKQQESKSSDNSKKSDDDQKDKDKEKEKKDSEQSSKQDDKKKQEEQDKQDQKQQSDEQEEQPSSQDEKSESEESKQSESEESDDKQQSESSKQAEASDQQQQQKQAQQAKENAEDDKKEQAKRRLREMMDAMRNRKKRRPAQPLPMPVKPVDKDW